MQISLAAFLAVFSILALIGAGMDLRKQIIPNWLNLTILVTGLIAVPLVFGWAILLWGLLHFVAALAIGVALFAVGVWGGGDAKFFAVCALWIPAWQTVAYLVGLALAGLLLLIAWYFWSRARSTKLTAKSPLPYGVAIALGGIFAIVSNPLLGVWPA